MGGGCGGGDGEVMIDSFICQSILTQTMNSHQRDDDQKMKIYTKTYSNNVVLSNNVYFIPYSISLIEKNEE